MTTNIEEWREKLRAIYDDFYVGHDSGYSDDIYLSSAPDYELKKLEDFIHQQLQKALAEGYEQGYTQGKFNEKMDAEYKHPEELQKARQDWLREEIVKLKGMEVTIREDADTTGYNFALQTIIDRYQAEVDQDKALQDKK